MEEPQAVECLLHEWAHALAWNFSLDRLSKMPGVDPAVFDRACHDEAWGCAYSRVWRAYQEVIREAGGQRCRVGLGTVSKTVSKRALGA